MKIKFLMVCLFLFSFCISQQYDTVYAEAENIDENNEIYIPGNVFVFDYEISMEHETFKLNANRGSFMRREFEKVPIDTEDIGIDKIHLLILPITDEEDRTNEGQTQIAYLQGPAFDSFSTTGAIENEKNVWIHPIRSGFFNSLETAPFPYIKLPATIGNEWSDQMLIGEGWGDELWGKWEGQLLLTYHYKITGKEVLNTAVGDMECYIIDSTAESTVGTTRLKSWFSEKYGFVRLEYDLLNDIKVNLWLTDYKTGKEFNDARTLFQTKEYIKEQAH